MAKLVDAPDLGSGASRRGGSSPFARTIEINRLALSWQKDKQAVFVNFKQQVFWNGFLIKLILPVDTQ